MSIDHFNFNIAQIAPTICPTSDSHTIRTKQKLVGEEDEDANDHKSQTESKNQSNMSTSSTVDTQKMTYPAGPLCSYYFTYLL